jgi:hypothetical protein
MTHYRYERVTLKGSPSSRGTNVEWLSVPFSETTTGPQREQGREVSERELENFLENQEAEAWRIPVEQERRKSGGRVTGQPFKIPKDVISKLGDGDLPLGVAVLYRMFGERPASHPFGTVSAETIAQIGNGNMAAGRKVLTRFVGMVRSQRAKTKAA